MSCYQCNRDKCVFEDDRHRKIETRPVHPFCISRLQILAGKWLLLLEGKLQIPRPDWAKDDPDYPDVRNFIDLDEIKRQLFLAGYPQCKAKLHEGTPLEKKCGSFNLRSVQKREDGPWYLVCQECGDEDFDMDQLREDQAAREEKTRAEYVARGTAPLCYCGKPMKLVGGGAELGGLILVHHFACDAHEPRPYDLAIRISGREPWFRSMLRKERRTKKPGTPAAKPRA